MNGTGWKIAFGVSAALNLVFVVAVVMAMVLGPRLGGPPGSGIRAALVSAGRSLPPDQAGAWRHTVIEAARGAAPDLRQARAMRRQVWLDMASDHFDTAHGKATFAQARALDEAARTGMENRLIDFAAALPTDQRKALAAAVDKEIAEIRRRKPVDR